MSARKRTSSDYFIEAGIRETRLLRKYFHIAGRSDHVRVTEELGPNDILGFFREFSASVRPPRLSDKKILPEPDASRLRGLYVGQPDVNSILNLIVRHALYVDQIVLVDPFTLMLPPENPRSPQNHPEIWAE